MLRVVGWLLNLMAVACAAWGFYAGYSTYNRELSAARARMHAQYEACAAPIRAGNPDARNRINILMLECAETLDDDRWLPVFAPNLTRDTFTPAAEKIGEGLVLALLALVLPRGVRQARKPVAAEIVS
jgi:hypothetical protein